MNSLFEQKNAEQLMLLRLQLAMSFHPTQDQITLHQNSDRARNPYNDDSGRKPPQRTPTEITSDLAFTYADQFLARQYGSAYASWLELQGAQKDMHNQVHHFRRG